MQDLLIVPPTWTASEATALAVSECCVAYLVGIPPVYAMQADAQGWSLPCVVTEDADGSISAWRAV
jgi:hypothetical protein